MAKKRVNYKKAKNRIRGKYAQSVGDQWETTIQNETNRVGHLLLIKQHPETGFFGRGQARVIGTVWADFVCIGKNFAFTFDAKTTKNKKRLTIPQKKFHQFAKLKLAHNVGVPAFYLTWWRTSNTVAAHFVNKSSDWPFIMDIETAEFITALEPGWMKRLVTTIEELS